MNIFEQLETGVETGSAGETQELAAQLAAALPPRACVALHGDLGSGKTTFVQGLARGLGVADQVTSPTFNYYHIHSGRRQLVHLDAYRLHSPEEAETLWIEDFLADDHVIAVEWPENTGGWLPPGALHLHLKILSPGRHRLWMAPRPSADFPCCSGAPS